MNSYDDVRYSTHSHPPTHPDRLAVIARLFGLAPTPVTNCRVLEIGCGDGNNLIPIGWSLPGSQFTGIDLASAPIANGNEMIKALGIENVRLVNASLTDVDESWGPFDYIVAHGFYSWVPAAVRDHLMKVCGRCLSPNGVAFVSYNAYPGCRIRDMMRDMMLFHVKDEHDPAARTRQAKSLLKLLAAALEGREGEGGSSMLREVQSTLEHTDSHMYHDDLAAINDPVYFTQFMQHASEHGLQYLGEADYFEMSDHTFPQNVREVLDQLRPNRVMREQYLDFLKFRRFRQTLLCRGDTELQGSADAAAIREFQISSTAVAAVENEGTTVFRTPKGARVETDLETGLLALAKLQECWPCAISFPELASAVARGMERRTQGPESAESIAEDLEGFLLSLYSAGVVAFHTLPPLTAIGVDEHPMVSAIVRWQSQRGNIVTTLHHDILRVDDQLEKRLLWMLDGSRDKNALCQGLYDFLKEEGAFAEGISDERRRDELQSALEQNLRKLSRFGLLLRNGDGGPAG